MLASDADALRLNGRQPDARRFDQLAGLTLAQFPVLRDWLARRALVLLEQTAAWERVLACVHWFVAHPHSQRYLRQLDIVGVDTKFIETRKALLTELLDSVLPPNAVVAGALGARQFEQRYGLLAKPATVRFRILDPAFAIDGLTDLSVPVAQFAHLATGVERVFVTENETNGLAFPEASSALVIFGGGYGIERLADIGWLRERAVFYWGDIDTHGFAILDRLRANLPQVRSLLMDAPTLHTHRHLWGQADADKRFLGQLQRLSGEEGALYYALRDDAFAPRVGLEQERIAYGWVCEAVSRKKKPRYR